MKDYMKLPIRENSDHITLHIQHSHRALNFIPKSISDLTIMMNEKQLPKYKFWEHHNA